jgi:uncharacterized protein
MRRAAISSAVGLLLLVACGSAETAPSATPEAQLPLLTGRVVDGADLLTPEQESRLAGASAAVERDVGPQFVIATVDSLGGLPIEEYGLRLARSWAIGSRERNDGLLLLVAPNERRVRIEVGTGLENRVTDPFAAKVLRERVLPRFRESDYPAGIVAGSEALIGRLRSRQSDREIAIEDRLAQ